MPRKTQKRTEIEHRRTRVVDLYLKGWTQAEIARELDVSQATVCNDIKATRKEWRRERVDDLEDMVQQECRRLLKILAEAWAGWEASKQPLETAKVTQKNEHRNVEKIIRQQSGDPRYIKLILETTAKLHVLLPLENASQVQAATPVFDIEALAEDARRLQAEKDEWLAKAVRGEANGIPRPGS